MTVNDPNQPENTAQVTTRSGYRSQNIPLESSDDPDRTTARDPPADPSADFSVDYSSDQPTGTPGSPFSSVSTVTAPPQTRSPPPPPPPPPTMVPFAEETYDKDNPPHLSLSLFTSGGK
ncbi:hypothetical protein JCM5296_005602 [Sporobolomyces johnsonii]